MTAELALPSPVDDLAAMNPALRVAFEGLVADGIPANTERTYRNLYGRFDQWCARQGLQSQPVTGAALGGYITHLSSQPESVQPSTLRHLVSVIAAREKAAGRGGLSGTVAVVADRAIRGHVQRREYGAAQKAYPLVFGRIRDVAQELDYNTFIGLRAGLILSLGYSGAMRVSEQAALRLGDVTPRLGGLNLHFWKSKTDQTGRGEDRPIPAGNSVLTDPVTRLREYLEALESFGFDISDPTLPLLRAVTSKGEPRPLLVRKDKRERERAYGGLVGDSIGRIISATCRLAGFPQWESVSGHSLRAGFATACAFQQSPHIPLSAWADHGRWVVTSSVPMLYVRDANLVLNNPLQFVGV